MSITLKDDRFFVYTGNTQLLDVLANDIVPADFTMTVKDSIFYTASNVGNQIEFTARTGINRTNDIDYTITDNMTGEAATATAEVWTLAGTPGLGGFRVRNLFEVTEDDGTIDIDLDMLIDPFGTAPGYVIDPPSLTGGSIFGSGSVDGVRLEFANNTATLDLDQFSELQAGESSRVFMKFNTTRNGETAESTISFTVNGVDDVSSTITTVSPGGFVFGDADDNFIESRPNQMDIMLGAGGINLYELKSDYFDGNSDKDIIADYDLGQDVIRFVKGSVISSVIEVDDGVILGLDGGQDTLFVFGEDASFGNLLMLNHSFPPVETQASDREIFEQSILEGIVLEQLYIGALNVI